MKYTALASLILSIVCGQASAQDTWSYKVVAKESGKITKTIIVSSAMGELTPMASTTETEYAPICKEKSNKQLQGVVQHTVKTGFLTSVLPVSVDESGAVATVVTIDYSALNMKELNIDGCKVQIPGKVGFESSAVVRLKRNEAPS